MTEAETILKLIEEVDPNDSAKLDEIDARVWCWLNDRIYHSNTRVSDLDELIVSSDRKNEGRFGSCVNYPPLYTRSRIALKYIRPKDWYIEIKGRKEFWVIVQSPGKQWKTIHANNGRYLPTEELAELHAIIQAIAHERRAS